MGKMVSLTVVIAVMTLCACETPKNVSVFELNEYLNDPDHGLKHRQGNGDMQLVIEYRPTDLIVKQQLSDVVNNKEREVIKRQFDSLDYFVLRFSKNDKEVENSYVSDPARLSEIESYFSQGILSDLSMITPTDTLRPVDVVYTRTFGMSRASSVLVVFKSYLVHRTGSVDLYFEDSMLATGRSKFTIDIDDVKNIPALNID